MQSFKFTVSTMVCDRCVQAVTQAIQGVDAQAEVEIDLGTKAVAVKSALSLEALTAAIDEAGHEVS